MAIIGKYDKLIFNFEDSEVELDGDTAIVLTRFESYAETKPKQDPPEPAKKWEIIVNSRIDFRKEGDDWKVTYWRLIPDFIKFEEEPLEQ